MKNSTTKNYIIHIVKDKVNLIPLYIMGSYKTKKEAKKAMMDQVSIDLTHGRYYYYHLIEQKNTLHEIYPPTET